MISSHELCNYTNLINLTICNRYIHVDLVLPPMLLKNAYHEVLLVCPGRLMNTPNIIILVFCLRSVSCVIGIR